MKVNPIIIVDDTLCYSLVKAQKVYEKNRKKKDKKEIRVAIYTHKGDVKPCHTFLVKTTTDFTNLYLQMCHIIYLKMERLQYLLYNEDMSETIRKQKEEEYELLKKYEDEAEEWYISYVIEKEREKENCDMWYVTLLSDPYEYEQYDYFSPIDIIYMAYHLALFDKEHGAQIEDFNNLLDKNGTIQIYNLQKDSSVTLYCGTYKEDKKEQEEIDNDYRKQAKELVNKMVAYLKKDSTLPDFDDRESLFKVPSSSNDFYVVTRDAYFHSLKLFKQDGAQETGQIKQIKVLAGDINDFYVEMTYTSTITYLGETETMGITYHYRIKKGKDCYLVAFIGYRVPGDIGLVKCDPVIEKDVSTNEDYAYSVGGQ